MFHFLIVIWNYWGVTPGLLEGVAPHPPPLNIDFIVFLAFVKYLYAINMNNPKRYIQYSLIVWVICEEGSRYESSFIFI
jgi:hypothetical protein